DLAAEVMVANFARHVVPPRTDHYRCPARVRSTSATVPRRSVFFTSSTQPAVRSAGRGSPTNYAPCLYLSGGEVAAKIEVLPIRFPSYRQRPVSSTDGHPAARGHL